MRFFHKIAWAVHLALYAMLLYFFDKILFTYLTICSGGGMIEIERNFLWVKAYIFIARLKLKRE